MLKVAAENIEHLSLDRFQAHEGDIWIVGRRKHASQGKTSQKRRSTFKMGIAV
jgi:hypothetical protein